MDYFLLKVTDSNRIWKNNVVFSEDFLYGNEEVKFSEVYNQKSKLINLKIKALNPGGNVVDNQKDIVKKEFPYFCDVRSTILIREDIFKDELFSELKGLDFLTIKINGHFNYTYKLICFSNLINCIDFSKSVFKKYEPSTPTLLVSKIPSDIDGFFLSGWNSGIEFRYNNIVNENVKNKLMKLEKASDFLIFTKVPLSNDSTV